MSFSRKKFLEVVWKSCAVLLVLPSDLISSCTWEKREYLDPLPQVKEEPQNPYIPPVGQSLSLSVEETSFIVGEEVEIKWEQTELSFLNLYFSSDDGATWTSIEMSVPADSGSYLWTIPLIISSNCLLRLTNAADEQLKSESSSTFRIKTVTTLDLALYPSLQTVGGSDIMELFSMTTIIIRTATTDFLALSMHCTHNGCIINYNGSTGFDCSCHGSKFNDQGGVIQGPAQKNLPQFETYYNTIDNALTITI